MNKIKNIKDKMIEILIIITFFNKNTRIFHLKYI